ncbi:alpha/beta hydrolase family protein [Catellatospora methionotrophica]|uniref:alpha/beta hydrolase family protein n=1 Tax=Catellatospora methionotrophica TaxID=121620 RepID=UPI0033F6EEEC
MNEMITGLGMSPLEALVLLGAVALVLARWTSASVRRPVTLAAVALVLLPGVVLVALGPRWHMAPVLAGAGVALAFAVPSFLPRPADRPAWRAQWWLAAPGSVLCLVLIAVGPVTAWALPVPVFPEPSGQYSVGTTVLEWTDPDREETATPAPSDHRTVVVQLWYPAQKGATDNHQAQYLGRTRPEARTVADALAGYLGMPKFVLDNIVPARTHSMFDVAAAPEGGRFPVVLFSPGLGGVRTQNTAWAEELASRGYLVVGLDHPYDSAAVVLADGRTIRTMVTAAGDPVRWTAVRAADLSFVLTQLDRLDKGQFPSPLSGRIDIHRAAVTGHSIGGAAALQAARQDTRFAAVINLDGFPRDPADQPLQQPILAVAHPVDPQENPTYLPSLDRVLQRSTATSYLLTVPGSAHLTFTDGPLYLPPVPALVGSLSPSESLQMTVDASAAFLDTTLRNKPDNLSTLLSAYGQLNTYHRP